MHKQCNNLTQSLSTGLFKCYNTGRLKFKHSLTDLKLKLLPRSLQTWKKPKFVHLAGAKVFPRRLMNKSKKQLKLCSVLGLCFGLPSTVLKNILEAVCAVHPR